MANATHQLNLVRHIKYVFGNGTALVQPDADDTDLAAYDHYTVNCPGQIQGFMTNDFYDVSGS